MANNALLFNAALGGYLAGVLAGTNQQDAVQADYAPIVAQAVTFATAMDAAIATDTAGAPQPATSTGISVAGGAAIVPAGSTAVFESQQLKANLLKDICFGMAFQRFATGIPAANFTVLIAAIKAVYFQTVLSGVFT